MNGGVRGLVYRAHRRRRSARILAADAGALGEVWEDWAGACGPDGESFSASRAPGRRIDHRSTARPSFILASIPETQRLTLSLDFRRSDRRSRKRSNLPGGNDDHFRESRLSRDRTRGRLLDSSVRSRACVRLAPLDSRPGRVHPAGLASARCRRGSRDIVACSDHRRRRPSRRAFSTRS